MVDSKVVGRVFLKVASKVALMASKKAVKRVEMKVLRLGALKVDLWDRK